MESTSGKYAAFFSAAFKSCINFSGFNRLFRRDLLQPCDFGNDDGIRVGK